MPTILYTETTEKWLAERRSADRTTWARIVSRIERLRDENAGDFKNVKGGVVELRLDFGPGYRVFYTRRAGQVIVILCGGDKSTQARDLKRAKEMVKQLPA